MKNFKWNNHMKTLELLHRAGCDMEVVCDKKWEDLLETEVDEIRFCEDCKKPVFYTTTPAELRLAAEQKLCVYIAPNSLAHRIKTERFTQQSEIMRQRIKKIEAKALRRMKGATLGSVIIK
jgi:hypothetical protein